MLDPPKNHERLLGRYPAELDAEEENLWAGKTATRVEEEKFDYFEYG